MTEKMLEMVSITSLDIQREIITCIPEVLDDSEHTEVARKLRYSWLMVSLSVTVYLSTLFKVPISRGFINIFSRRATGFHR